MKRYLLSLGLICSVVSILCNDQPDLIVSFKIVKNHTIIVKANPLLSKIVKKDFFAKYDESIDLTKMDESIVTIPFILSIIPVVWISNGTYSIDVMDKDLYYSLQKIREVFRVFYPYYSWSGKLIPKKLVTNTIGSLNRQDQPTLALLFSGGLDSVNTSISHVNAKQLLITAWGADVKVRLKKQWSRVLKQCQNFSQIYGHDHTFVKSNFREFIETPHLFKKFYRWWVRVSHGLSLVGLTAPLLVQHNISTLFIASTFTVNYPYPLGSHPAIDNNISFAGSSVYSAGSDKDRAEKIMNINAICKEENLPLPKLRVCWSDSLGKNCLECGKCMQTYTNIIAAGQEPREYDFNIDVKNSIRKIRKIFSQKKRYLHSGQIFHWQSSLSHLNALSKHKSSKDDVEKLRNFLCSVNFEQYRNPRARIYSPQRRELFAKLWKQNMKEVKV